MGDRQPRGIPAGGQFAATAHGEPALSLAAETPKSMEQILADRYLAAKDQYEAHSQNTWVESVRAKYPDAAFACVDISTKGDGRFTSGMDLYRTDSSRIKLDEQDSIDFEVKYDPFWEMDRHATEETSAIFVPDSGAFSLDSVQDRWAEVSSSPEPSNDPFAHLTGMDRAKAQSAYAQEINREATDAYVKDLSKKLLAINPEFARLYVNRNADVESGLTFNLDHVEDIHRNHGDGDLMALENHDFQDIHLDGHVDYDEKTDRLYINLDPGE
ncbi:hypothetical protein GCM10023063_18380 [Arthrobacter methylotrophus]|uniref:Uncharacterized protein n=1 Tax=Arthrobacter methylotrophus TaxID=121291 RepID=A0ABV5UNZ2_9MICC